MDARMTPTERLQAAIDRLTELRDRGTPGPWWHDTRFGGVFSGVGLGTDVEVTDFPTEEDADLIVTLHNALPWILEILEGAHRYMLAFGDDAHEYVIGLADAILAAES